MRTGGADKEQDDARKASRSAAIMISSIVDIPCVRSLPARCPSDRQVVGLYHLAPTDYERHLTK